nr:MAG TPA: hypothetical protein [Caudoviricetes sp.]
MILFQEMKVGQTTLVVYLLQCRVNGLVLEPRILRQINGAIGRNQYYGHIMDIMVQMEMALNIYIGQDIMTKHIQ